MSERILQCVSGQSSITLRPKPKDLPADGNNTLRFRVSSRSGTELQDGLKQILQDLSWRLGLKVRMGGWHLLCLKLCLLVSPAKPILATRRQPAGCIVGNIAGPGKGRIGARPTTPESRNSSRCQVFPWLVVLLVHGDRSLTNASCPMLWVGRSVAST